MMGKCTCRRKGKIFSTTYPKSISKSCLANIPKVKDSSADQLLFLPPSKILHTILKGQNPNLKYLENIWPTRFILSQLSFIGKNLLI